MDINRQKKLDDLISRRNDNLVNVQHFEELFYKAFRMKFRRIVEEINFELENKLGESLKIFYDNPYEATRNNYFAMLQYFTRGNKTFFLDNTENNPAIMFEGVETSGKVKISIKTAGQTKFKIFKEVPVTRVDDEFLFNTIVNFLEQIYLS